MSDFLLEINSRTALVRDYIRQNTFCDKIAPDYLKEGVLLYPSRGGKMLRPAIVLLACEAVGGDVNLAIPAAAAMEISHIWTLVHDDIIDNDDLRRSGPSVHAYYRDKFKHLIADSVKLEEFSKSMAILTGDLQQAWATNLLNNLNGKLNGTLFKFLIDDLTAGWIIEVVEGETLDVEYSQMAIGDVSDEMLLNMLTKKTASTFAFAGRIGSLIGLNKLDLDNNLVRTIEDICLNAGLAFQLKDDILGIMGTEKQLGKPIGSDIKEGKRTLIITHAYARANDQQKRMIEGILGNPQATNQEVKQLWELAQSLGSIEYIENLANNYIDKAKSALNGLPESNAKTLLNQWIDFMTNRLY